MLNISVVGSLEHHPRFDKMIKMIREARDAVEPSAVVGADRDSLKFTNNRTIFPATPPARGLCSLLLCPNNDLVKHHHQYQYFLYHGYTLKLVVLFKSKQNDFLDNATFLTVHSVRLTMGLPEPDVLL